MFFQLTEAQTGGDQDLRTGILNILKEHNVPGAAVALITENEVLTETFGLADMDSGTKVTDSTLFGIGSISKTFLGLVSMRAQEKGILDIEANLYGYLKDLEIDNSWKSERPVKFIHLLEHTSGFDEAHFQIFGKSDSSTDFGTIASLTKNSLKCRWRPGDFYAYNNFGAMLAAYAIEERTNMPYGQFVRDMVLIPMGMENATFSPQDLKGSLMAKGYSGNGDELVDFPSLPIWPAGSLAVSLKDMAHLVRMFLDDGRFNGKRVLGAKALQRMETPETSLKAKNGIKSGYAKGIRSEIINGHTFLGHNGTYGGFLAAFGYSRRLGKGYIVLLNNRDSGKALKQIKDELFGTLEPLPFANLSGGDLEPGELEKLAGCYVPFSTELEIIRFAWRLADMQLIVHENRKLYQKSIIGDTQQLVNLSGQTFKRPHEPEATSLFIKDGEGRQLWLDETSYRRIPAWLGYTQFYGMAFCLVFTLVSFVVLLIWLPVAILRKRKKNRKTIVFTFLASLCFLIMWMSLLLYDNLQIYSIGALLFYIFSWLFLVFSAAGLFIFCRAMLREGLRNKFVGVYFLVSNISLCTLSTYLAYWHIIGLRLWDF